MEQEDCRFNISQKGVFVILLMDFLVLKINRFSEYEIVNFIVQKFYVISLYLLVYFFFLQVFFLAEEFCKKRNRSYFRIKKN
jgi:hypothetical protein